MLGRYLLGVLLGALVVFLWGAVWWMISPLGFMVTDGAPDEEVVSLLSDSLRDEGHGVYFYPWVSMRTVQEDGDSALDSYYQAHARGPLFEIIYSPAGKDLSDPMMYVSGFIHLLASTTLAAALLMMALPALPTYGRRVLFLFLVGTFAGVVVELAKPIWFYHPWDYVLYGAGYQVTAWLLAALAMAAVIKPRYGAELRAATATPAPPAEPVG
ncbi:MAG TPA: hypothetical protein VMT16_14685 [Thermoanaerobaculia bacterium]|nr:hypothetical protein [Thermoanaerobaculia bacterium]